MKKMRINNILKTVISITLTATLLALPCLPSSAAPESVFYIKNEDDLVEVAKNCRLDTYSRDKTFILANDIMLVSGFTQIPVFRGTFDGAGHTISGYSMRGNYAPAGFFGIVEYDGAVKNLVLEGHMSPHAEENRIGGIAGENFGLIEGCVFRGNVSGKEEVGGIAGFNALSGSIKDCRTYGKIKGQKMAGGIAGANHGLIDGCTSECLVNVESSESYVSIEEIESEMQSAAIEDNGSAERFYRSVEDSGGIAGFSDGIITNSVNTGDVGYNHIGYNIGGVVGRNQGFVYGADNFGVINGRREVGGIAGQAEPFVASRPDSDNVGSIREVLHRLQNLVDKATRDVDDASSKSSQRLSNINGLISKANDNVKDLSDIITGYMDENLEEINRGSDVVKSAADRLDSIAGKLPDINRQLSDSLELLSEGVSELNKAGSKASESMDDFTQAAEDISKAMDIFADASGYFTDGAKKIAGAIGVDTDSKKIDEVRWDEIDEGVELLSKGLDILENGNAASGNEGAFYYLKSASVHIKDGMEKLKDATKDLESSMGYMEKALDILNAASDDITGVLEEVSSLADFLSNTEPLKFSYIKSRTEQAGSDLHTNISNLSRELDGLNEESKSSSDTFTEDIRAINDQFFVVMDLLVDEIDDLKNSSLNARIEDVSDEDINNSTDGKIRSCVNHGEVYGDINVGGIAGSMGIFNDQNPEESNATINDTLRARYKLKAILQECTNFGRITSKKDFVGAICGVSFLGVITDCKGYGHAISEDGDYVGGISGGNSTTIRNCYSKCSLSGKKYVGGIAGLNSTKDNETGSVSNCISSINIESHEQYSGAICGYDEGEIKNNFFFGDYAGINNTSYVGKAEPLTFEELVSTENIPLQFKRFEVTFKADDKIVKQLTLDYLDSYSLESYPPIPPVAGQYGKWDKEEIGPLVFDEVITVEYFPYITAISSALASEEEPARFFALGKFNDESKLDVEELFENKSDFDGVRLPGEILALISPREAYKVTASDLEGDDVFLRYYKDDGKPDSYRFYYKNGDTWVASSATETGTYLQFEVPSGENDVIVAHRTGCGLAVLIVAIIAVAAAVIRIVIKRKRRRDLRKLPGKAWRDKAD